MSEELDNLIRQAEIQKLQMELNVQLEKNLNLFADRFPQIYELVKDREATKVGLHLDENGSLNLVDVDRGCHFYNGNPKQACEAQIASFQRKTRVRRFRIIKNNKQNDKHLHIQSLNALIDEYAEQDPIRIKRTPSYLTNLIVSGVGLGYHLPALIAKFDIQNILIYEKCVDTFYASLHTIDWRPILDYFQQENRTFSLCVGVSAKTALSQVKSVIDKVGLHTQVYTFFLKHTDRPSDVEFIERYDEEIQFSIRGLGYFDDERIGIAHAHHNLMARLPVFVTRKNMKRKTPVLIVGNGPSLDLHERYLAGNKDNAIVVSCGTALTSLLRMGIKPDFHVEMERPALIEQAIRFGSTDEQRKDITLLCLHTVAPKTIACFQEACYAIKPNDAGTSLVHSYYRAKEKVNELAFCNPTVANCALSFFANMGFLRIHLIGIDFGVLEDGEHHSKKSIYYDFEKYAGEGADKPAFYQGEKIIREGNLGGQVSCSEVLDTSRGYLERLLENVLKVMPDFECLNSNQGAKILHTVSRPIDDVSDLPSCDKSVEIAALKQDHFYRYNNKSYNQDAARKNLAYFFSIKDTLKLPASITNEKDLIVAANNSYKAIAKTKDPISHYLLRGTLNCFIGSIVENSFYCKTKQDFQHRAQIGIKHYNQLIENIYRVMKTAPFELDDTQSAILSKIAV